MTAAPALAFLAPSRVLGRADADHFWVRCDGGHTHYGEHGAAGLILSHTDEDGTVWVLMNHRGPGVHHAGTWGWPGGAVAAGETPEQGARREASEETGLEGLPPASRSYRLSHGGWAYETFVVEVEDRADAVTGWEGEVRWMTVAEATRLPLVPGALGALTALFPL
jgi:8-oxo-dGTP diphosphatase